MQRCTRRGLILLLGLGLLLGWQCKTSRKAVRKSREAGTLSPRPERGADEALQLKALHDTLLARRTDYTTFSARARVDVETEKEKQQGITVFIRMRRDSIIWISVRPVLGIEMARVLITPREVQLVNYFKKTVTVRSIDSLQEVLHLPFDFSTLQDLLAGNPVYLTDSLSSLEQKDGAWSFMAEGPEFSNRVTLSAGDYRLQQNHLTEKDSTRRACDLRYEDYEPANDGRSFPLHRMISVATPKATARVDIRFVRPEFDQPLTYPFAVSSKYRRE
ncbi:DUF4292 domain-containing protein [Compostibacter hankyongensis]|uniref:DUF4292 domain-containing protein n=1 Tax=Compostibacter hankyongensis TaxID=1007089 RepID=A0ABP8FIF4_9BACT